MTTTTPETKNTVDIETVGPARKRLTITIPVEAIQGKLSDSMGALAGETALPGFRKGRVPQELLERRFGERVRSETRNQLIADAYAAAIEEHKIKPVGEPEPVEKMDDLVIKEGQPLSFAVEVEVTPEFDLPTIEGIKIDKPMMEVTEEHIKEEMDRQCISNGDADPVKEKFVKDDRLIGFAKATKDGEDKPFFERDSVMIVHPGDDNDGRGQVLGVLVEGLAGLLKGEKVGDTVSISTKGPESHEREDIRGADITIEFKIKEAWRIVPATLEEVLEVYGMSDESMLREQIQFSLERRRDQEQNAAMREQVYEHLIHTVDFDLPEKLSAAQAERSILRQEYEMHSQGVPQDDIDQRLAEMRSETEESARQRLKLFFILHRLSEEFSVSVSDQELNARITAIAHQRGMRPEQLRTELTQAGRLDEIGLQIREHKTTDRIIDKAEVKEVSAEEWAKRGKKKSKTAKKTGSKKKTTTKKKTSSKKKSSSKKSS